MHYARAFDPESSSSIQSRLLMLSSGPRGDAFTQLEERPFDGEEQDGSGSVNANLDPHESRPRCRVDISSETELFDKMDHEFLNEVGAVSNAGDECGSGDPNPAEK